MKGLLHLLPAATLFLVLFPGASTTVAQDPERVPGPLASIGEDLWRRGVVCRECHGNMGNGRPEERDRPAGANFRESTLTVDAIAMVIRCGLPGTGMPSFGRNPYVGENTCYGQTAETLGDRLPPAGPTMSTRQIDALAQFIAYQFVGRGPATYEECIAFYGPAASTCREWPTRAELAQSPAEAGPAAAAPAAMAYQEAWRIPGFEMPESVSFDPGTQTFFVGNIASPDFTPNGQGYISQVGLDGTVVAQRFVEGLNTPLGTDVRDGRLWVVVAGGVAEIDIATATVVNTYMAEGTPFLNDVFVADDGRVFVSDVMAGAIYVLEDGALSVWVQDPMLAGANGITIVDDTMYVATLGDMSGGFENLQPSNIKTVDLATKAVADYGSPDPIGGLDGIEPVDGGMMVTDNSGGRLLLVASDGTVTTLAEPGMGAADHEYVAAEGLVVIPMTGTGDLIAYRSGALDTVP